MPKNKQNDNRQVGHKVTQFLQHQYSEKQQSRLGQYSLLQWPLRALPVLLRLLVLAPPDVQHLEC